MSAQGAVEVERSATRTFGLQPARRAGPFTAIPAPTSPSSHTSQMADIDELERAASAFPDLDDIGGPGLTSAPTSRTSFPALGGATNGFGGLEDDDDDDDGFGAFGGGGGATQSHVRVTGGADDEVEKFESQFPDIAETVSISKGPTGLYVPVLTTTCDGLYYRPHHTPRPQ